MQIRGRDISPAHKPYVIAEVSCNHAGSEAVAHALIDVAVEAGAEAVKFQFYTPEGMVGPIGILGRHPVTGDLINTDTLVEGGPWNGEGRYALYDRSKMPFEWGPRLKARCHDLGLAFIASAYEVDGLNWLEANCQPDAYKVASFEATDTPFLVRVALTGKPFIVSLGMTTHDERRQIYRTLRNGPNGDAENFILLHCVSAYPTAPADANLWTLGSMAAATWGFSDHTLGSAVACAAVALGACVLEKHIQLSPHLKTADSAFSATPDQFRDYITAVNDAWAACQPPVGDVEAPSRQFRRAPGGKRGSYQG